MIATRTHDEEERKYAGAHEDIWVQRGVQLPIEAVVVVRAQAILNQLGPAVQRARNEGGEAHDPEDTRHRHCFRMHAGEHGDVRHMPPSPPPPRRTA